MLEAFEHIRLVTSLGGIATTLNTMSTSHRDIDDEARERSGIHPGLLRLAVGIEGLDALQADLARGLRAATAIGVP
jgi:cystathionine beta-lyase/cystathionine gamma-synthase